MAEAGEIALLFKDWLDLACDAIGEYSGRVVKDWRNLREQAIKRCARLGVEWSDDMMPEYVMEALRWDDIDSGSSEQ